MNTEYQLADTITETLTTISSRCSTTDSIKDQLMYVTMSETHITEGSFWFDPEVELPTDNI